MRYLYTLYKAASGAIPENYRPVPERLDTTTRAINLRESDVTDPYFVVVDDMLKNKGAVATLKSVDDLEDWKASLERAYQWADEADKANLEVPVATATKQFESYEELRERFKKVVKEVEVAETKVVNLKTIAGAGKPKTSPVPPIAILALGAAMQDGANKYGRFNWRTSEVTASVFFDAMMRHLLMWYAGEDKAPDSKVNHLAHLMAGAAILLDAMQTGVLIDDRDISQRNQDFELMMKIIKD